MQINSVKNSVHITTSLLPSGRIILLPCLLLLPLLLKTWRSSFSPSFYLSYRKTDFIQKVRASKQLSLLLLPPLQGPDLATLSEEVPKTGGMSFALKFLYSTTTSLQHCRDYFSTVQRKPWWLWQATLTSRGKQWNTMHVTFIWKQCDFVIWMSQHACK